LIILFGYFNATSFVSSLILSILIDLYLIRYDKFMNTLKVAYHRIKSKFGEMFCENRAKFSHFYMSNLVLVCGWMKYC